MKKTILALVMCSAAAIGMAQQTPTRPYATVQQVEGLVTVTSGNQLSNVTRGMPLPRGAQVLNTATGRAIIQFASGCTITLEPRQTVLIEEEVCAAIVAQGGGASGGLGAGSGGTLGAGAGLLTPANLFLGTLGMGVLYDVVRTPSSGS